MSWKCRFLRIQILETLQGVEVCESAVDRMLGLHAARAAKGQPDSPAVSLQAHGSDTILTGADGTMIPVLIYDADASDRRKANRREFKEMCLFVSREKGTFSSSYARGVFDGAEWIRRRFEEQFGEHGDWLVDFLHLAECLALAISVNLAGVG